jgi:intein/homing endonuclease
MKQKLLIKEEGLLKTYPKNKIFNHYAYIQSLQLKNFRLDYKKIAKKLNVSMYSIYDWLIRKRNNKPLATKSMDKAQMRGYFSIRTNSKKAAQLAYLVGFSMGDGNISRCKARSWFYGHPKDLEKVNLNLIKNFGVTGIVYTYKPNNAKMAVHDTVFTRLLVTCGAPVGDKTNSATKIPMWIKHSSTKIKVRFLQGLFDSELNAIQKMKNKKNSFQSLKFYTIKTDKFVNSGVGYLNEIRHLLREFKIKTSEHKIDRQ